MGKEELESAINALESAGRTIDNWVLIFAVGVAFCLAMEAIFSVSHWLNNRQLPPLRLELTKLQDIELAKLEFVAAEANRRTEELRADNLALQKIMQPRRLGSIVSFSTPGEPASIPLADVQFSAIKPFAGTPVLIQVVPDFEAQTLANDIALIANVFGWRPQFMDKSVSHLPYALISDGVMVTYPPDSKFRKAAEALADGFTKAGLKGPAGWGLSAIYAQGYPVDRDGKPVKNPLYPSFDDPVDAVIVLVGMKPIPAAAGSAPK
ncbi:MAG: hypothetical protein ABSE69_20655 [Roseiarcus sp.]|jgi:hypothetical protein